METAEYWPMACKYAIWNTTIASLQFWAEDLDPITLGIASECVYTTFFWTPTSHTLHQLSEDVLFGCFVIALNAAFTQQLSLADEGYESGSNTMDLPTPLRKTPHIHHVSSMDHASFNPAHTTPHRTVTLTPSRFPQMPTRPLCCHLSFNSNSDQEPDSTPIHSDSSDDYQDPDSTQVYSGGSLMSAIGTMTLHLRITEFKLTHNFIICYQLPEMDLIFGIDMQRKFSLSYV